MTDADGALPTSAASPRNAAWFPIGTFRCNMLRTTWMRSMREKMRSVGVTFWMPQRGTLRMPCGLSIDASGSRPSLWQMRMSATERLFGSAVSSSARMGIPLTISTLLPLMGRSGFRTGPTSCAMLRRGRHRSGAFRHSQCVRAENVKVLGCLGVTPLPFPAVEQRLGSRTADVAGCRA